MDFFVAGDEGASTGSFRGETIFCGTDDRSLFAGEGSHGGTGPGKGTVGLSGG